MPKRDLVRGQELAIEIFLQRLDNSDRAEAAFDALWPAQSLACQRGEIFHFTTQPVTLLSINSARQVRVQHGNQLSDGFVRIARTRVHVFAENLASLR